MSSQDWETVHPAARTQGQLELESYLRRFTHDFEYAEALMRLLRRDNAEVYRAEPARQRGRWHLFVFLPELLQSMFDIELEVMCLATNYEHLEPRIANDIRDLVASNPRVDPNIVIVVSPDPGASAMLSRRGDLAVLVLSAHALSGGGYDESNLRTLLGDVLLAIDHFDVRTPVSSSAAFFGRQKDVQEVRAALARQQHVGVFGLRKAGKTSLLNRVSDLLIGSGQAVARLDLNTVLDDPMLFRARLVQAVARTMKTSGRPVPRLRLLNSAGEVDPGSHDIRLVWLDDLARLLDSLDRDLVLVLDEIDTIVPAGADATERVSELLEPLAQLRGLIQSRTAEGTSSMVLLAAGVDPSLFECPILLGRPNPMYQFSTLKYLGPFSRDEMAEMVRALGKRSGLRFDGHQLIDLLQVTYGGHPLLTRQACSYVHSHRTNDSFPYKVDPVELTAAITARGPNTPQEHLEDVLASFREWFPGEADILQLAISVDPEERELVSVALDEDQDALVHAIGYGLLTADLQPRMRGLVEVTR